MLLLFSQTATQDNREALASYLKSFGVTVDCEASSHDIWKLQGNTHLIDSATLDVLPYVEKTIRLTSPYPLAQAKQQSDSLNNNALARADASTLNLIIGPCSFEIDSLAQTIDYAANLQNRLRAAHAPVAITGIRVGAFKPRTSPYMFEGSGRTDFKVACRMCADAQFLSVAEIMDTRDVEFMMARGVRVFQIGARNMQNYPLLKEVGQTQIPVLLKRSLSATLDEWLLAAEYILREGNTQVALVERGQRHFSRAVRASIDIGELAAAQTMTHLPIYVDPSHAAGKSTLVAPIALSVAAQNITGLEVEIHPNPVTSKTDATQALTFSSFDKLVDKLVLTRSALYETCEASESCQ